MNININGKDIAVDLDGDTPLLWVIRDELNYTGTKLSSAAAWHCAEPARSTSMAGRLARARSH